jgi:hypothetical protein
MGALCDGVVVVVAGVSDYLELIYLHFHSYHIDFDLLMMTPDWGSYCTQLPPLFPFYLYIFILFLSQKKKCKETTLCIREEKAFSLIYLKNIDPGRFSFAD